MREVRKRFTKSELAMMAWRSAEMAHNMSLSTKQHVQPRANGQQTEYTGAPAVHSDAQISALEARLGPVAYKMVDDKGEVALGRLTGNEALQYMAALGIRMGRQLGDEGDPVAEAYRNNQKVPNG